MISDLCGVLSEIGIPKCNLRYRQEEPSEVMAFRRHFHLQNKQPCTYREEKLAS